MSENLLNRKDFESLTEDFKWEYVDGLYKTIKSLRIQADKNCEECESEMLAMDDINIDYKLSNIPMSYISLGYFYSTHQNY